jgi:hypothetical protein
VGKVMGKDKFCVSNGIQSHSHTGSMIPKNDQPDPNPGRKDFWMKF